ncbi:sulfatase-like hydrolase/transferase [Lentisphaera profundi]|uniref:Sulfatase-like hydrolase/transferase n=1 Tax=Lentisphaera profundi TaxID=1658616 RepID=A0ABY7VWZ9_9BACT|nr:sulfatase-like hydrolase/transferase [Lentisphaera profundi]WDE97407.1 sulfatase-like hydrolase/transferase [Lentisphaera profundi]
MLRFSIFLLLPLLSILADTKPNILIIMNDQHHGGVLGSMGVQGLNTPNLDKLSTRGTYFDKAYCTQPICVPSRTSMMTGKIPHQIDAQVNRDKLDYEYDFPVMGEIMSQAGYRTAYMGKTHLIGGAGRGFDLYRHTKARAVDHLLADTAIEFIQQESPKPFFVLASYRNPHDICQWARGDKLPEGEIGSPPENLAELPALPHNFTISEDEPDCIRYVKSLHWRTYPTQDWEEKRWRQYVWAYHRLIEKVDTEIGKLSEFIAQSKFAKNTVVIFLSDHGDGCACHQWNQKSVLYEESVRVPFIIVDPASSNKKNIDKEALISTGLDLIPTLCDYAGIKPPNDLIGQSLKPLMYDKKLGREYVVSETEFANYDVSYNIKGRMLRTDRYKYVAYDVGNKKEQFFDLKKDPGEMNNLIKSKAHLLEILRHRKLLKEWCDLSEDNFLIPELTKKSH